MKKVYQRIIYLGSVASFAMALALPVASPATLANHVPTTPTSDTIALVSTETPSPIILCAGGATGSGNECGSG